MHTPAVAGQDTGHDRKVSGIRMVASAAKACDWVRCNTWVVVCGEKETGALFVGDDHCVIESRRCFPQHFPALNVSQYSALMPLRTTYTRYTELP